MASIKLGYPYATEPEAQVARQEAAIYYGLPITPDDVTIYYADYYPSPSGKFYFNAIEGLVPVFGAPQDISSLFISGSI